jgi:hypothetical protein
MRAWPEDEHAQFDSGGLTDHHSAPLCAPRELSSAPGSGVRPICRKGAKANGKCLSVLGTENLTTCRPPDIYPKLRECMGGDNRPMFLDRTNVESLDVAQAEDKLYYFSAGFLTFKQSEFTSCLSADRPLRKLECRVGQELASWRAAATWNPSCVAEAQVRLTFSSYRGVSGW